MKRSLSKKNRRSGPPTPGPQASVATVVKMDAKETQASVEQSDSPPAKKIKMSNSIVPSSPVDPSYSFTSLSLEVLCQIMQHLTLKEVMRLQSLSRKLHEAVSLHLRLLTSVDFTESQIYGWMPTTFTDTTFKIFINRCPDLKYIYGLHNEMLARRRQRGQDILSIPGIIEVLSASPKLEGVETSDIFLLEAFLTYMPRLQILRPFRNRDSGFPIPPNNRFQLTQNPQITTLHLTGVVIPELPRMDHLKHLHLRWVRLTHAHPFRDFVVPQLCSFVMSNCAGPTNALKYVPLITGLAAARSLNRIELVRVPFLGGLIQHVVEDSWRMNGFRNISKIVLGSCKHALEVDLGYLAITCANRLSELSVQPSLTKDSFFASLSMADVNFPAIESVNLGFVDDFPEQGKWTNEQLVTHGLADVTDSPAMITDIGLKAVGKAFPGIRNLSIYNCPHLHFPNLWFDFDVPLAVAPVMNWTRLRELHLRRCHAIRLQDLCRMIPMLPCLESLILEQMFREPPKGCSRVGLSAGTGLGVSAALVQNTGNDAANQDLANNNPPGPPPNPVGMNNQVPPNGAAGAQPGDVVHGPVNQNEAAGGAQEGDIADNVGVQPAAAAEVNDDNDIIDEELDDGDMWEAADFEMHCSCCGAQLEDPRQTQSDDGKDSMKNNSSSANGEKNSETVSDGTNPQAGPSGLQEPRPSSSCSHSSGRSCHRNCQRSKTTSDNIGSGRVLRSKSSRKCAARMLDSQQKPEDTPSSSKSNGKSLRGNKKGLVKKSASSSNQVHQACQASSDEIRETTKKAKENEKTESRSRNASGSSNGSTSGGPGLTLNNMGGGVSTPKVTSRQSSSSSGSTSKKTPKGNAQTKKRKTNMVDKATSTSDPVIEDDHVQILMLRSASLLNLSLRQVGVTDLVIQECPRLQTLTGSACRVLSNVHIKHAPLLQRVSFAQCRKLRHADLIKEVCMQPPEKNRLILLRPMQNYDRTALERQMFERSTYHYHMCAIHDYASHPANTMYNRYRIHAWLEIMASVNSELIKHRGFRDASQHEHALEATQQSVDRGFTFPWSRHIYSMQGKGAGDQAWELLTDMPWLRALASTPTPDDSLNPSPDDDKPGMYNARGKGHAHTEMFMDLLEEEIAEAWETKRALYVHSAIVYINTCDINGIPTPDIYV